MVESSGPASSPREAGDALWRDIALRPSPVGLCFVPVYAMRVSDGVRTVDFVVCFHCLQALVFEDGKPLCMHALTGSGADIEALFVANDLARVAMSRYPRPKTF